MAPENNFIDFVLPGVLFNANVDRRADLVVRLCEVEDVRVREAEGVELRPVVIYS